MSLTINQVFGTMLPAVQNAEGRLSTAISATQSAGNLSNADLIALQADMTNSALTVSMAVGIADSRKRTVEGVIQKF